jgi:hypothetical protein
MSWMLVALLCPVSILGLQAGGQPSTDETKSYDGQVVPLSDVVEKLGGKLDTDAAPYWLALRTNAGLIYPLIKDDGARMFFKDAQLLRRPMRLTGRLLGKSQLLQVVEVHSYRDGKLCELYYWCPVCSIKRYEKKLCDCCGGPMTLEEKPAQP